MAGYQNITIVGNVGRDAEMKYLPSGIPVCNFSVAVTRRWNDRQTSERKEETTWFRVAAWRGLGETCNQYVHKGMQIMVTGTVKSRGYLDAAGQPQSSLELTADNVQFLGQRGDATEAVEDDTDEAEMSSIPF